MEVAHHNRAIRLPSVIGKIILFDWWRHSQKAVEAWPKSRRYWLLGIAILSGVVARLWAQALPGNWDFGQWMNVSSAALAGVDPYATYGYNYPPPWLATLAGFQAVASDPLEFRFLIAVLLALTDIGIFLILVKRGYLLAGCLFFLSPIAIAISGQHQQVESIALFLAFAAALLLSGRSVKPLTAIDWFAAGLLGLSLAFKPIFMLLPLWFLIRKGPMIRRLMLAAIPFGIFVLSILSAFFVYPPREVASRIFGHTGTDNAPFINAFVPSQLAPWVVDIGIPKIAFVVILLASAWFFRRLDVFEMTLAYTVTAVLFSWAVANQYLLTPMAAVAVYLNIGFAIWLALSAIYLGGASDILNIWGLRSIQPHVMLDWTKVFQDLFPWLLAGWIIMLFSMRQARKSPDLLLKN